MRRHCFLLALLLPAFFALPAHAGFLFGKQNKPNPAERVPQLIAAAKTSADEDKRAAAVKELRDYDSAAFPEIVPILIDVLQHDTKPGVRAEAAQSLGKMRPISQEAGSSLEEATGDDSIRVRLQARTSLMGYRLSGYHSAPKQTEAPAATPAGSTSTMSRLTSWFSTRRSTTPAGQSGPVLHPAETEAPPLAVPLAGASTPQASIKKPVPMPLAPSAAPKLKTPPPAQSADGPDLPPLE
jgi:hypothetical protein